MYGLDAGIAGGVGRSWVLWLGGRYEYCTLCLVPSYGLACKVAATEASGVA